MRANTGLSQVSRNPRIEAEEVVYTYEDPDNGAHLLWCIGSTCIARAGENLFGSGVERKTPRGRPSQQYPLAAAPTNPDGMAGATG
jgi:hypothetical protein